MPVRRTVILLVMSAIVALAASVALAQAPTPWHIGDRVEAQDVYTSSWEKGTITEIRDDRANGGHLMYKAHLDQEPKGSTEVDLLLREDQVRAITTFVAAFKPGDSVDVYYSPGVGHANGVVQAVGADGRYKIHYPGCTTAFDELVDYSLVLPPKKLSRSSKQVRFLIGKWIMFTPSYPTTVVNSDGIYREYGTGARTPPLIIKANGRYVWHFDFGKKPVKGRWKTEPKLPGADTGTAAQDGVVIKDPTGKPWKVYKRSVKGEHKSLITAQRMCSGITDIGTKAR